MRSDLAEVQHLLKSAKLPYTDIEKHIRNFILIKNENEIIGCVGLEVYEDIALIRSLAVDEEHRNQGLGKKLTTEILEYAFKRKIKKVFLLTTTAEAFFAKLGFIKMNRSDAPVSIQTTTEFTSLCPDSAVFMCKELNRKETES